MNAANRPGRRRLASRGYPMWLVAVIAVALLVLPWVITVASVRHHHLDVNEVAILAAVTIPLSGLWLAWVTLAKAGRVDPRVSDLSMGQVADQLADAVSTQWKAEAVIRGLYDPYPLPVSWAAADPSLTDPWGVLVTMVTSGAGWPLPAGTWAAGPDDLAGQGEELADVLARVPTGRLIVLGEPGTGKTLLMVRLVLDLLARRAEGGPVPFLASVASWNPIGQDLRDWLVSQLLIDHPALAGPPPTGMTQSTLAAALLGSGLILPVLDGLDEIPEKVRGPAVSRINAALRPGEQVVVTCRTRQYQAAVRPKDGTEVTLRGAAAVQLCPLDADSVRRYLCDEAAPPAARARWDPVLAVLGTEVPVAQALRTPLMIGLARAIYNPRPGELAGTLRDPAELFRSVLPGRAGVEALLFDGFIPAAYREGPGGRWKAQDAEKWLVFLAYHLESTIQSPDLAWWELPEAVIRPPWDTTGLRSLAFWTRTLGRMFIGVRDPPRYVSSAVSPATALSRIRRVTIAAVAAVAVTSGVALGLLWGRRSGVVAGVVAGVAWGAWVAVGTSILMPGSSYEIARIWLALRHRLPWALQGFLDDAHKRGVLRQVGAIYQFRHIELQHRLAKRDMDAVLAFIAEIRSRSASAQDTPGGIGGNGALPLIDRSGCPCGRCVTFAWIPDAAYGRTRLPPVISDSAFRLS